ncbi:MAG: hypothetical protein DME23_16540 [Verrucomicrobia bacterium]|nr:MAG: hypothetical protein DME23_16540 [Verrucomicrobiota bacterium]
MNDLRYAFRQLLKNPGFSAVAVLTLALGIGANLALFAILNELLLRPKPVANPDELWAIEPADSAGQPVSANVCRPYYEAVRQRARVFKGVIGYAGIMPKLRTKEAAERIYVELVSGDYFSFLGIRPALGRWFLPEEDAKMGTHSVAVISHGFWQRQLGGSGDVIGRTVTLNGNAIEIIGVAPREFIGLDFMQPDLWLPTSMEKLMDETTRYHFVGRLTEPKLAAAAADLLAPLVADVTKELSGFRDPQWSHYGVNTNLQGVRLEPIGRGLLGIASVKKRILDFLKFAGVATVLLLLIACTNVASLFLVRALQRRKEMATRLALGATRGALLRQLVGEGILIAALGTAGALLAFSWIGRIITQLATWWQGPDLHPALDLRLLLFAVGSLLLVGVGFSLRIARAPVRRDALPAQHEQATGGGRRLPIRSARDRAVESGTDWVCDQHRGAGTCGDRPSRRADSGGRGGWPVGLQAARGVGEEWGHSATKITGWQRHYVRRCRCRAGCLRGAGDSSLARPRGQSDGC